MLRRLPALTLITVALMLPLALAGHGGPTGHYYGSGHADMTWTSSTLPPMVDGTGTGHLTTNLATFGQAIAFQMPLPTVHLRVVPASAMVPVTGLMIMDVPAATDPWWATYPGGVPPGITSGGTVEFSLSGHAEHHPNAVNLFGAYTITAATGQYAGMTGTGQWSGSTTGGGSSFGPFFDFALVGSYA